MLASAPQMLRNEDGQGQNNFTSGLNVCYSTVVKFLLKAVIALRFLQDSSFSSRSAFTIFVFWCKINLDVRMNSGIVMSVDAKVGFPGGGRAWE